MKNHKDKRGIISTIWYSKTSLGKTIQRRIYLRDLKEMMLERGVKVDHTTNYHWIQKYAPELETRLRHYKIDSIQRS